MNSALNNQLINVISNAPFDQPVKFEARKESISYVNNFFKQNFNDLIFFINQRYTTFYITKIAKEKGNIECIDIFNKKVNYLERENHELSIIKNIQMPLFISHELGEKIGSGCEGIVLNQEIENGSQLACKFYSFNEESIIELRKEERLSNLKKVIKKANVVAQLPINDHVLKHYGIIYSTQYNQYGLIFEKIEGYSLNIKTIPKMQKTAFKKLFNEIAIGMKALAEKRISFKDLENNIMIRDKDKSVVLIDVEKEELDQKYIFEEDASKREFIVLLYKSLFNNSEFYDKKQKEVIDSLSNHPQLISIYNEYFITYQNGTFLQISWNDLIKACNFLSFTEEFEVAG